MNVWLGHGEPLLNAVLTQRDTHTARHCARVGSLAEALAGMLGVADELSLIVGVAARMHDVGKIGIPDAILRKAGSLNA